MKNNFYVLKYNSGNLGDDIQTVATTDLLDDLSIDYKYVFRDMIGSTFFSPFENNYVIMNGWFTNGYGFDEYYSRSDHSLVNPTWPPKGNFIPIFYSFHIAEWGWPREVPPKMIDEESISFYKSKLPVGCRDEHTKNLLQNHSVETYWSGCMTLTFNKAKYIKSNLSKETTYLVDVPDSVCPAVMEKLTNTSGYNYMVQKLSHNISPYSFDILDRFELAKRHLTAYANAKLVITTRLHVALPCLAFGTPVLFLFDPSDAANSRYADYIKFLTAFSFDNISAINFSYIQNKPIEELSNNVKNKFCDIIKSFV